MLDPLASAFLVIDVTRQGSPRWAVKWRRSDGKRVKTRLGVEAWVRRDGDTWVPRGGRPLVGAATERQARKLVPEVITREERKHEAQTAVMLAAAAPPPPTFRALAHEWLHFVETVKDVKPSTLASYRFQLTEPGRRHHRGTRRSRGLVMQLIGDTAVSELSTEDVSAVLDAIARTGVKATTVNRYREIIRAILNFGLRREQRTRWGIVENVATWTPKRTTDQPARLEVFTVEQVEAIARVAAGGTWRTPREYESPIRDAWQTEQDEQLGELIRVAAYTGIRRGELITLRWRDVDWSQRVLVIERALSATEERSTKGRQVRYVPLADQPLAALDRLSRRTHFTGADDYVFGNEAGERLDPSALRKRWLKARDTAGAPPLRFHDLRHTAGTLLTRVLDPVSVQAILGHADLKTTQRYLHARKASELGSVATKAFAPAEIPAALTAPDDEQPVDRLALALIESLGAEKVAALLRGG